MRILHVVECWGAGVRRAVDALVVAADGDEHHLLWEGEETPDESMFASVKRLPRGTVARISAVGERTVALRADVIHAHSSWAGLYARARKLPAPVVYEPHCYKFDDPQLALPVRSVLRGAERILAARTSAVFVLSDHEEQLAEGLSPRVPRYRVSNSPTVPITAPQTSAPTRVVMIGRVSGQKDPGFFGRVARKVSAVHPGLPFVWVGDGDTEGVDALRAAGVTVTGWLDAEKIRALLEGALYLHTARYEGFPISLLDAAASGCAILARDIAAFRGSSVETVTDESDAAARIMTLLADASAFSANVARARTVLSGTSPAERKAELAAAYTAIVRRGAGERQRSSAE